jgi:SAM-dependent methyltransferase
MRSVDPVEAEDACILCGSRAARRLFPARDRLHNVPGDFWVVRCLSCELVRTSPRPSGAALAIYYPDNYGPHAETAPGDSSAEPVPGLWGRLRRRVASRRIWWLPELLPGARVLELGSGSGYFVRHALARGWEVHALEPAVRPAERLARDPRVRVHYEPAETMTFSPESLDAVFAWMVLEHLGNPAVVAKRIAAALRPGGYFVFSVPNAGSWEFEVFRWRWYALQVPTHLWHFSPRTLRQLLGACGLVVERVFHQKVLKNITGSLELVGADLPRVIPVTRWLAHVLSIPYVSFAIGAMLAAVRQGGRLTVVARKPR